MIKRRLELVVHDSTPEKSIVEEDFRVLPPLTNNFFSSIQSAGVDYKPRGMH